MSATDVVRWSEQDAVFVVRLGRPPVNALGPPLIDGLDAALDEFEAREGRVLVLVSDVPGFFAAGADIKAMVGLDLEAFAAYGRRLRAAVERIPALERPSIAAVEGRALGGGMELALACTLRVGGADCRMGLPEAKIGLVPSAGATQRLPRYVGRGRALELMLTGREIDADEAGRIGLIDRAAAAGEAEADAVALARQLRGLSAPALRDIVRGVDDAYELPLAAGLTREAARVDALYCGPDAREGLRAFVEKRPPEFS
ncbi:MAG: Enoyl-CoA hydratase/isomerase [Conexibacter sp.]|nr:Enoyl-CoA hydratase/isomerase [Conexibacter sp.]